MVPFTPHFHLLFCKHLSPVFDSRTDLGGVSILTALESIINTGTMNGSGDLVGNFCKEDKTPWE